MSGPSRDWIDDCKKWRGRVLTGRFGHWCHEWDGLPVDETTTDEFACCTCLWDGEGGQEAIERARKEASNASAEGPQK